MHGQKNIKLRIEEMKTARSKGLVRKPEGKKLGKALS